MYPGSSLKRTLYRLLEAFGDCELPILLHPDVAEIFYVVLEAILYSFQEVFVHRREESYLSEIANGKEGDVGQNGLVSELHLATHLPGFDKDVYNVVGSVG